MPVRWKILAACLGFVAIIATLGGLAWQQGMQMGRIAVGLYDHTFIGMSFVDQTQEEFLRLAASYQQSDPKWHADLQKARDRLDVALDRAGTARTRAAGQQARNVLAALGDASPADMPERMAQADRAITKVVTDFSVEGLEARDAAEDLAQRGTRLVQIELAIAIGLGIGIGWLVGHSLSKPLVQLVRIIGHLASGELQHEIAANLLRRRDEIGDVARASAVFRTAMRQNAQAGEERDRQRIQAEADRQEAAALEISRMRLLSDMSQEILIITRDNIILQVNAAGDRMLGGPNDEPVGRRMLDLVAEADHQTVMQRLQCPEANLNHAEIHLHAATGKLIPVEFSCTTIDYEGTPARVMAFRDLSDRKRDEARIRHLAHHDPLTNLPNRFLLRERLAYALGMTASLGTTLAVLYLDLDYFKPVNDLLGHAAGDSLLIQVASRMQAVLRATDTLARVGGDEFVIVALLEQPEHAVVMADRLLEALTWPFVLGSDHVEIGTSIGIALYPKDGDSQEALMHAADTALYRAKQDQRGTFRFFEPAMDEHSQARQRLERDLRHAIERDEMQLHYQPLVCCVSGEVLGFEALLRWHHPILGPVSPVVFIPLAEKTGLIGKIGQWVLETACKAAAGWSRPHCVAVNISPVQFRQSNLVNLVSDTLARTGLPPGRLEIEITESVLMDDAKRAADVLSMLRSTGVRIALDDFGTGYSSLSYLHAFKFDKLKIDRSFTVRLGEAEDATIIVRTIIGLAHSLGLSVTAEGVETPEQLAILREFMCDQVQGYLLGRPMPMDGSSELIAARAKLLITGNSRALSDNREVEYDSAMVESETSS
jgi:diguanylate cyclase (GGDEF)-like protein/PAS domain S-box-containing protein